MITGDDLGVRNGRAMNRNVVGLNFRDYDRELYTLVHRSRDEERDRKRDRTKDEVNGSSIQLAEYSGEIKLGKIRLKARLE